MNAVQELVEVVGKDDTQFMMGVHYNSLYKWLEPENEENRREPTAAARNFARLLTYLLVTCGWTIEEVKGAIMDINESNDPDVN